MKVKKMIEILSEMPKSHKVVVDINGKWLEINEVKKYDSTNTAKLATQLGIVIVSTNSADKWKMVRDK